jgi:uncharacterized membrane protein YkvA (DUF1232 family)
MPGRNSRIQRGSLSASVAKGGATRRSAAHRGGFVDWFSAKGRHHEGGSSDTNGHTSTLGKIYEGTIGKISEADINYVLKNTGKKASSLLENGNHILVKLGSQVMILFRMLRDARDGRFEVSWGTILAIGAALFYFLDPFDLIPDFIPIAGFLDDATVIGICISIIQSDLKRYAQHEHINLARVGLPK